MATNGVGAERIGSCWLAELNDLTHCKDPPFSSLLATGTTVKQDLRLATGL